MAVTRDELNAFLDLPEIPVPNAQSGALSGLSLGVKDIFDVAGYVTGCGNPNRAAEGLPATRSAPAIQMLLDAGARFAGKTQTEELAFSMIGQNVHFPHPVNPSARDRITGGSSSGSAAAVAGGLVDIGTGSDTGGSIRAPASFCGLVGLRTTHGRISLDGTMPLAPSFDTFGWFAKDVETYEKVGGVLLGALPSPLWGGSARSAGVGVNEKISSPPPRLDPLASQANLADLPGRAAGLARPSDPHKGEGKPRLITIAALDELVAGPAEADEYRRMTRLVSDVLGPTSAASPPPQSIDELYWCTRKIQAKEAWAAHGAWISSADRGLGKATYDRFAFGKTVSDDEVVIETRRRADFTAWLAGLIADDGVIVLPTVPCAAPKADATPEEFQAFRERAICMLCWSGLSGFPQITLPLGEVDGAPFGISLLGPANSDEALIELAKGLLEAAGKA
jgi:amidase